MPFVEMAARIKFLESVTIPTTLYGAEVDGKGDKRIGKYLNMVMGKLLLLLLGMPRTTYGMLLTAGLWSMESWLQCKKLMLYHCIVRRPTR